MTRQKWALLISTCIATLALTGLVLAGVPANSATITLDHVKGKKGAVKFNHAKHADEYKVGGKAITCKECHHTLAAATADAKSVKACGACHVDEGKPQVNHGGKAARFMAVKKGDKYDVKSVIFHDNCNGCHKKAKADGKKIAACKTCHP